jgi:hypothetical protein
VQVVCTFSVSEGTSGWLRRSRTFGLVIKSLLDAQVRNNLLYLSLHPRTPLLYSSGVRYKPEPAFKFEGRPVEEFASIPVVLARLAGDCDDLAPWRCAELIHLGEKAKIRVQWRARRQANGAIGRKYFHIVVRRASGEIEDPSARLGMNG